jgi:hypothetical protein
MNNPDDDEERVLARVLAADESTPEEEFEEAEQYLTKGRRFSQLSNEEACLRWRSNFQKRIQHPFDPEFVEVEKDIRVEARLRNLVLPRSEQDLTALIEATRQAAKKIFDP